MTRFSSFFCLAAFATLFSFHDANAQRIRDLSLTPEETAKQPSSTNDSNRPPRDFQNDVSRRAIAVERADGADPLRPHSDKPTQSFMEGYCDPGFASMLANNRKYMGMEQCLQALRQENCARFSALPQEVKNVLNDAIDCVFAHSNSYAADAPLLTDNDYAACGTSYGRRIEMLKKYMGDAYAAYALVYLPDDVLDNAGRCVNRGQR